MFFQQRWPIVGLVPILAGLCWLSVAEDGGVFTGLLALVPGLLFVGAGVSIVLWPGDRRINQFLSLAAGLGVLASVLLCFSVGLGGGLWLLVLAAAAGLTAGFRSIRQEPFYPDMPEPRLTALNCAKVTVDEAVLGFMAQTVPVAPADELETRVRKELLEGVAVLQDGGYLDNPLSYHTTPPSLATPSLTRKTIRGHAVEHLSFDSEYAPLADLPGAERWLNYKNNRTAHALVFRHTDDKPRPWLVGIHGYQMGTPLLDFTLFPPEYLHKTLGFNLVLPTLPLHGPRRIGKISGNGYLSGEALDTLNAQTQATWDIRRIVSWIRTQGPTGIGVLGYSLGGYNTALLASVEDDLDCAIAGIALTDFADIIWRHGPTQLLTAFAAQGVTQATLEELFTVVSPLAFQPKLSKEKLALFAGTVDRIVPPYQQAKLWQHWQQPEMVWYQGGHLTFRHEKLVQQLISNMFQDAGLLSAK